MSDNLTILVIGTFLASVLLLLIPVVPAVWIVGPVLTLRSLTDVGAASSGSLLPSSAISASLGLLLVVTSLVPHQTKLPRRARLALMVFCVILAAGTVVAVASERPFGDFTTEATRWASLAAVATMSWRSTRTSPETMSRMLLFAVVVPAFALIVGTLVRYAPMIQASGRSAGTFSHANTAGAYFGICVVASVAMYLRNRDRWWSIAGALSVGAILFTQSLGGLAAAALGVVVVVVASSQVRPSRKAGLLLGASAVAIALMSTSAVSNRLGEIEGTDLGRAVGSGNSANSLEWRFINWSLLLQRWALSPLIGYGLGASSDFKPLGAPPHSLYFEILFDFGAVGILAFALLTAYVLVSIRRFSRPAFPATLGIVSFVTVNGAASNILNYTPSLYIGLAFVMYFCSAVVERPALRGKSLRSVRA